MAIESYLLWKWSEYLFLKTWHLTVLMLYDVQVILLKVNQCNCRMQNIPLIKHKDPWQCIMTEICHIGDLRKRNKLKYTSHSYRDHAYQISVSFSIISPSNFNQTYLELIFHISYGRLSHVAKSWSKTLRFDYNIFAMKCMIAQWNLDTWTKGQLKGWQNTFAITWFRYIEIVFHIFCYY